MISDLTKSSLIVEEEIKVDLDEIKKSVPLILQGVNERDANGKMIEDENLDEGTVGWPVYKKYLRYLGGWKFVFLSQVSVMFFTAFKILNDY